MKMRVFAAATAVVLLASCETAKEMQATGGSRADGTVNLSYEYGIFERPVVDRTAAQETARSRCAAWGYPQAQPFGGQINHCNQYNTYGACLDMLVTVQYQCTGANGGPPPQALNEPAPTNSPVSALARSSTAARLGIGGSTVTSGTTIARYMNDPHGVFVSEITPGSAADRAGLKREDVIESFNGLRVSTSDDLDDLVSKTVPGSKVTLGVWRNQKAVKISVGM
jgi:hypothetical protein